MATIASAIPTLLDVTRAVNPDGTHAKIAEILHKILDILDDIPFKEGNLITGDRTTVRVGLPSVGYRRLNEGVPRSKSASRQVDESAALLEGNSLVDRKLAILSQNPAQYRLDEASAFLEAMNQQFATTLFYGNSTTNTKEFTGLSPRFNSLSGPTSAQIIDAGGTGTDNRSIWLIAWDPMKVTGIYPKGTVAGLQHMDATTNLRVAGDGFPTGDMVNDANGNPYLAYQDHWEWQMGLSVPDPRYVIRIANIDRSDLTKDFSTGADLQDLMIQATELIQNTNGAVFYMPRALRAFLRRQLVNKKNGFLSYDSVGGKPVLSFDGIPIKRVDILTTDEARVT